jgi:hypothetical protein
MKYKKLLNRIFFTRLSRDEANELQDNSIECLTHLKKEFDRDPEYAYHELEQYRILNDSALNYIDKKFKKAWEEINELAGKKDCTEIEVQRIIQLEKNMEPLREPFDTIIEFNIQVLQLLLKCRNVDGTLLARHPNFLKRYIKDLKNQSGYKLDIGHYEAVLSKLEGSTTNKKKAFSKNHTPQNPVQKHLDLLEQINEAFMLLIALGPSLDDHIKKINSLVYKVDIKFIDHIRNQLLEEKDKDSRKFLFSTIRSSFDVNYNTFKTYVKENPLITEPYKIINRYYDIIKCGLELIETDLKPDKAKNNNDILQEKPPRLEYFFDSISKYKIIMDLLVEKDYCQAHTYIWKDENNGKKGFLAAVIKYLHTQGYYKKNRQPSNDQIKEIALNTFGLKISIDTVKKSKLDQYDVSFIPVSTTI